MNVNDFFNRVKEAIKAGAHAFVLWFQCSAGPELMEFLDDNKDLAMDIVTEVAEDLAGSDGETKRGEAFERITGAIASSLPRVESRSGWINLLIEIAVCVLKSRGKI